MASYSIDILEDVAQLSANWDSKYFYRTPSSLESFLRKEFRLLLQYLFINEVPNPLNPERALLTKWLDCSRGFDVYSIRRLILERLHYLTRNQDFLITQAEGSKQAVYPDFHHLVRWHNYHHEIFTRSRTYFDTITTDKIIDAEQKTLPFYKAMELAEANHSRQLKKSEDIKPYRAIFLKNPTSKLLKFC